MEITDIFNIDTWREPAKPITGFTDTFKRGMGKVRGIKYNEAGDQVLTKGDYLKSGGTASTTPAYDSSGKALTSKGFMADTKSFWSDKLGATTPKAETTSMASSVFMYSGVVAVGYFSGDLIGSWKNKPKSKRWTMGK